jgi:hypothetical protein
MAHLVRQQRYRIGSEHPAKEQLGLWLASWSAATICCMVSPFAVSTQRSAGVAPPQHPQPHAVYVAGSQAPAA